MNKFQVDDITGLLEQAQPRVYGAWLPLGPVQQTARLLSFGSMRAGEWRLQLAVGAPGAEMPLPDDNDIFLTIKGVTLAGCLEIWRGAPVTNPVGLSIRAMRLTPPIPPG